MESYFDQLQRCAAEYKEKFKPFDFYKSKIYAVLIYELEDALKNNDLEECQEIIEEIEQEKRSFKRALPDWFKIRWRMKASNAETFKKALELYREKIYL